MTVIINPGSSIGEPGEGWTNTYRTARSHAERWLARMQADGFTDVELLASSDEEREGRWSFSFRHSVTGVSVTLEVAGIDDVAAYERRHVFAPRTYWNGSSTADPKLEDFAAPGFVPVRTFTPDPGGMTR